MYSACIHCHAHLGSNEVIESFPAGRRLAFDFAKGRLWVVCISCGRWNLTPLEERWDALEEAERQFRGTRLRVCSDNIGLAKLPEGLELVRVGRAERSELAAWRYADVIAKRRRRAIIGGAVTGAALVGAGYGLVAAGLGGVVGVANTFWHFYSERRILCRMSGTPDAYTVRVRDVHRMAVTTETAERPLTLAVLRYAKRHEDRTRLHTVTQVSGHEATVLLSRVLAYLNRRAGRPRHITAALKFLEEVGDPLRSPRLVDLAYQRLFAKYARRTRRVTADESVSTWHNDGVPLHLTLFDADQRLALEMAANEETERRALEGELAALEAAWKEAEEIASIADDMLIPSSVRRFIEQHRSHHGGV